MSKMWPGNYFLEPFFQELSVKKDSEVSRLMWINFDSLAITYLCSLLQKFHFPIEVKLTSLKTKKDLELVFTPQFFYNFLMIFFLF